MIWEVMNKTSLYDCLLIQISTKQLDKGYKRIILIRRGRTSETTDLVRAPVLTTKRICVHIVIYTRSSSVWRRQRDKLTSLLIIVLDLVI